jgi:hypothetical protein
MTLPLLPMSINKLPTLPYAPLQSRSDPGAVVRVCRAILHELYMVVICSYEFLAEAAPMLTATSTATPRPD